MIDFIYLFRSSIIQDGLKGKCYAGVLSAGVTIWMQLQGGCNYRVAAGRIVTRRRPGSRNRTEMAGMTAE